MVSTRQSTAAKLFARAAFGLAFALTSACGAPAKKPTAPVVADPAPKTIHFVEDDYAKALATARAEKKLLLVDTWAPWCHSCLAMRANVFPDPALSKIEDRFVWLAIDTEKASNASFVEKFPVDVWPTIWVIDPQAETPMLRWGGTATAGELLELLESATAGRGEGEAMAGFIRGTRAAAEAKVDEAIAAFAEARAAAKAGTPLHSRIVEAELSALERKDPSRCLALATAEAPNLAPGTSKATTIVTGISCGVRLREQKKKADMTALLAAAETLVEPTAAVMAADDRSSIYEALVEEARSREDKAQVAAIGARWVRYLDREVLAARSPDERVVFDGHRLLAYDAIGELDRAVPMLEATARDLPKDYNSHARLAWVHLQKKRFDAGIAEVDKALSLAYGPRKLRIYKTKVDLLLGKGDKVAAKKALEEGLAFGASLPPGQGRGALAELEKRKAKFD